MPETYILTINDAHHVVNSEVLDLTPELTVRGTYHSVVGDLDDLSPVELTVQDATHERFNAIFYLVVQQEFELTYYTEDTIGTQAEFCNLDAGTYDVKVRAWTAGGESSDWATYTGYSLSNPAAPAVPTNLQIVGGGTAWESRDCPIEWDDVSSETAQPGIRIKDYKVEVRKSDDTLLRTVYVPVPNHQYLYGYDDNTEDNSGSPEATLKFRVYSRDVWNTLSATYASLTATNSAPSSPTNLTATAMMGGVSFEWDENTDKDFKYFLYRILVT